MFHRQATKLLYRIFQKHHPMNKITTNLINLLNILNKILNKLKHTKTMITKIIMIKPLPIHQIILLKKITSQVQVKNNLIKNQDINIGNQ